MITQRPKTDWREITLKKYAEWHWTNFKNIISYMRYRIVVPIILLLILIVGYNYTYNILVGFTYSVVFTVIFFIALLWALIYTSNTYNQLIAELALNHSIYLLRKSILSRRKQKDMNSIQYRLNKFNTDLFDYISTSSVIIPPMPTYELDRLNKSIDIYINSISEVLFNKVVVLSREQEIMQEINPYEYTPEELEKDIQREQVRSELGIFDSFDFSALNESLNYLGDILFSKRSSYTPFSYKHPIEILTLNMFFEHWNNKIAVCSNCIKIYQKIKEDVEKYYLEQETSSKEYKQRIKLLIDSIILIIITSVITVLVTKYFG
jgi:hypothetical protein